jgi:short-chain Z-isoprenyl diphosphate synthase
VIGKPSNTAPPQGLVERGAVEAGPDKVQLVSRPTGRTRRFARARDWLKLFLYLAYERRLVRQIDRVALPRHIGIILDGNRRFGRRRRIQDPHELYALGAGKLDDVLDWCVELGISAVTLWVCSTKNLERPAAEVSGILAAIQDKLIALAHDPRVTEHGVRARAAGRLDLLPETTRAAVEAAQEATKTHDAILLTIAIAYDGRAELVDALQSYLRSTIAGGEDPAAAVEQITPETIARHLYAPDLPDPDLIIRTSGELRLSGFLLWQSAYSEFYFTDIDWPDFRKVDFLRALRAYQQRQRRFGL